MKKPLLVLLGLVTMMLVVSCGGVDASPTQYVLNEASPSPSRQAVTPPAGSTVHAMRSGILPGRLNQIFNDSNHVQLEAAVSNGIEPITDLRTAFWLKQPVVKVASCNLYYVDSMKYAMPYLVPKAATLLGEMAKAFQDTIKARGGKVYRIRVNSALRTDYSVRGLMRRNRAATEQSCHRYGTTFDVSWTKFDCMDPSYPISLESLKNILAEVVYNFRQKGRCYAIFEPKRGCFHITAR